MRMTRLKALLLAVALAAPVATPASAESLTDALIAAYRTSGLLAQNRALLRAADEDVAQSVAALRPVLSYVGSVTYSEPSAGPDNTSASLSLAADWLLYDFGQRQLATDAAKETVLATRAALIDVEQAVLLRAVAAFLDVRRATSVVELRRANVRLISEQLRAARDRFEVGEVTRTDVSIAEARLAAAQSGLAAADGDLARAREEYRAATGAFPGALSAPPAPPQTAGTLAEATAIARARHPDIERAQREVTVAELNVARAAAGIRPRLSATARVGVDDDGDDSSSVGLSLSGPIYQGGQIASQTRQAQARRDAARAALYTTGQAVDQNVGTAWANLRVATASLRAFEEEVSAARLALRGAQEELQVGSRTTLDVLDREQELLDAQTNLVSAQIDRNLAAYSLLSAMGLLTADHLQLGVVTYDPAAYYNAVKDAPTTFVSPQGEKLDRVLRGLNRE